MTLFTFSDIAIRSSSPEQEPRVLWHTNKPNKSALVSGTFPEVLKQIIAELEHAGSDTSIFYTTMGVFSMHQLLEALITLTGSAEVHISTWAMTEIPCRAIAAMIREGTIQSLHLVFDHKIRNRSPEAVQLATALANSIIYAKCHAKTTVIRNDQYGISIIGSANYTRNPRIESGVIVMSKNIADWNILWMERSAETSNINSADDIE